MGGVRLHLLPTFEVLGPPVYNLVHERRDIKIIFQDVLNPLLENQNIRKTSEAIKDP